MTAVPSYEKMWIIDLYAENPISYGDVRLADLVFGSNLPHYYHADREYYVAYSLKEAAEFVKEHIENLYLSCTKNIQLQIREARFTRDKAIQKIDKILLCAGN